MLSMPSPIKIGTSKVNATPSKANANEPTDGRCTDHNNLETVGLIHRIMSDAGVCNEKTKIILSNIPTSRKRSIHEELSEAVADLPYRIAYDGYFVSI